MLNIENYQEFRFVKLLLIHNICCQNTNKMFVDKVACDNISPKKGPWAIQK